MKKRILSLLLALVMVLSVMTVAAMAKGVQTFADVKEPDWFYDAVCYVTDNGLMKRHRPRLCPAADHQPRHALGSSVPRGRTKREAQRERLVRRRAALGHPA